MAECSRATASATILAAGTKRKVTGGGRTLRSQNAPDTKDNEIKCTIGFFASFPVRKFGNGIEKRGSFDTGWLDIAKFLRFSLPYVVASREVSHKLPLQSLPAEITLSLRLLVFSPLTCMHHTHLGAPSYLLPFHPPRRSPSGTPTHPTSLS
jgi:hypothetical protein